LVIDAKFTDKNFNNSFNKLKQIENYVYHSGCRFDYILKYFGERKEYRCGKCDNCRRDNATLPVDATQFVNESVLKTVYHFPDGISPVHIFTILLGNSKSENYQRLPMFGICSSFQYGQVKPVFNLLLSNGYIFENSAKGNRVFLTNKGYAAMVELRLIDDENHSALPSDPNADLELFFKLKGVRERAALRFTQPAYLICSDELLAEFSKAKPKTKEEFLAITGTNERMFNKFGEDILSVINSIAVEPKNPQDKKLIINSALYPTWEMIKTGRTLKDIATARNMSETVVSMQIEELMSIDPTIDLPVVLTPAKYRQIEEKYKQGFVDMKSLKDKLGEGFSYPEVRVYLSQFKFREPVPNRSGKQF
jgi:Superfamily II DNA helicase